MGDLLSVVVTAFRFAVIIVCLGDSLPTAAGRVTVSYGDPFKDRRGVL